MGRKPRALRALAGAMVLIGIVLMIPVVPFALFGESLEKQASAWLEQTQSSATTAVAIAALLATDVFLPVPSSVVSTIGGAQLGTWLATGASWTGMTIGAIVGFAVARACGPSVALRFSRSEDWERIEALSQRVGPSVLVLTRPLPVLAEASVLFMGATRLSWRRFLVPVALSNLGIALVYSAFGAFARGQEAMPAALAASIAVPLLATTLVRALFRHPPTEAPTEYSK